MNTDEIVIHEVERHGMSVVLDLLGKGIGQPSEAPHVHPHGQIIPLGKRRADMLGIRLAFATKGMRPNDLGRAVPLRPIDGLTINLDQHGIVHVCPEARFNGFQIGPMPVRGYLYVNRRGILTPYGGQYWTPITPRKGSISHAGSHDRF